MKNQLTMVRIILGLILALGPAATVFSQELNSAELIAHARQYDEKLITYTGEVIGDVMARGEFAWVNINDGDNAIGVWMSAELAKAINFRGSYKSQGDILEITGVFHRACLEHGGDLDLHAQISRKITHGKIVPRKIDYYKLSLSFILLGALLLLWILSLFRRK